MKYEIGSCVKIVQIKYKDYDTLVDDETIKRYLHFVGKVGKITDHLRLNWFQISFVEPIKVNEYIHNMLRVHPEEIRLTSKEDCNNCSIRYKCWTEK